MKNLILTAIVVFCTAITAQSQDILLLKKNGGAMEGYLQKVTKKEVYVKFGIYTWAIPRKDVEIIYGIAYSDLKSKGKLNYLHEIDHTSAEIRKALKDSKSEVKKKVKENSKIQIPVGVL